jgi:pimeloyl-ACP methyl ester carboxylesterase
MLPRSFNQSQTWTYLEVFRVVRFVSLAFMYPLFFKLLPWTFSALFCGRLDKAITEVAFPPCNAAFPRHETILTNKGRHNVKHQFLMLTTSDGANVPAIYVNANSPNRPVIMVSGGNGMSALNMVGPLKTLSRLLDCSMFCVQNLGYAGTSRSSKATEQGCYDAADAGFSFLLNDGWLTEQIVVAGFSLGSGVSCYLAETHPAIGGIILLGGLSSTLRACSLAPGLHRCYPQSDVFKNIERAPNIAAPAIVAHGESDCIVSFSDGHSVARKLPNVLATHWVPFSGHGHAMLFARDALKKDVACLLDSIETKAELEMPPRQALFKSSICGVPWVSFEFNLWRALAWFTFPSSCACILIYDRAVFTSNGADQCGFLVYMYVIGIIGVFSNMFALHPGFALGLLGCRGEKRLPSWRPLGIFLYSLGGGTLHLGMVIAGAIWFWAFSAGESCHLAESIRMYMWISCSCMAAGLTFQTLKTCFEGGSDRTEVLDRAESGDL